MNLRNVLSFLGSAWGALSAFTVFFPFFNQVTNIVYVPALSDQEKLELATINSLICSFVLLFCFAIQYLQKNLTMALLMFIIGIGALLGYQYLTSPITALLSLGINADISYLLGYEEYLFKGVYWLIFASFTGAFTSIAAFFYQPHSSRYAW